MERQTLVSMHSCMDASALQLLLSFQHPCWHGWEGPGGRKRGTNGDGEQSWQRGEQRCGSMALVQSVLWLCRHCPDCSRAPRASLQPQPGYSCFLAWQIRQPRH